VSPIAAGLEQAVDGSLLLAVPVVLLAGLVSFFSPCVLPLVPGYLAWVTGLAGADAEQRALDAAAPAGAVAGADPDPTPAGPGTDRLGSEPMDGEPAGGTGRTGAEDRVGVGVAASMSAAQQATPTVAPGRGRRSAGRGGSVPGPSDAAGVRARRRRRVSRPVLGTLLFVLGFSAVFVSLGALFGTAGVALREHADVVSRLLGVVTVVLGLGFLGWIPFLQREVRLTVLPRVGLAGAPLLGVVFGLGWTPCIGPTLAAVQSLAFTEAGAARGAFLSAVYCLGLGLPFVAAAAGVGGLLGTSSWARRHARTVTRVGGALLVIVGVLLVTGWWEDVTVLMTSWLPVVTPGVSGVPGATPGGLA
jgi:cytochrome c-type biogenesis protein